MKKKISYRLVHEDETKFVPVEERRGAMDIKKILFWGMVLAGGWYLLKKIGILNKISLGQISRLPERTQFWPQETTYIPKTGMGIGGSPRFGRPKTEAERRATHKALFGDGELPPRGTGLKRRGLWI